MTAIELVDEIRVRVPAHADVIAAPGKIKFVWREKNEARLLEIDVIEYKKP
jgi:hypothetical protein